MARLRAGGARAVAGCAQRLWANAERRRGWRTVARGLWRSGDGGLAGEQRRGIVLGRGGGSRWRDAGETEKEERRRLEQDSYMTGGPRKFP